jgi:4a-hydroxytetrahydrobiopterin dehydratase
MDFTRMKCAPCKKGAPPKSAAEVDEALRSLDGWAAQEGQTRIHKRYRFRDFVEAMRFVNGLAALAEAEGHHPDFAVHWNTVDVTLWTHDVGGLSQNDFIVAAKLDTLPEGKAGRAE